MQFVVAIDGPAASGKGTLARRLAEAFDMPYLDTGLLYRAVGRKLLDTRKDPLDTFQAEMAATTLAPSDLLRADLRGPDADDAASKVATIPGVRAALVGFQRSFAKNRGGIIDGRDIGTIIFPDANLKLFITAALDARATRRWLELCDLGIPITLYEVTSEMSARDTRDAARTAAPLVAADDAYHIDTTAMTANEVFEHAKNLVLRAKTFYGSQIA